MTTTGPTNGSDAPDPNTVPGWSVQGSASQTGLGIGVPSAGYAQAGNTASAAALTTTGNGTPGVASPVSNNTSVANETSEILANPGYGNVSPSIISAGGLPATLVPVPASGTAFTNPVGLNCQVSVTSGTVTAVSVKIAGTSYPVGTGDGTYTLPPGASITMTYSSAPPWTWIAL